jgi:uncharacterized OB-fold protein
MAGSAASLSPTPVREGLLSEPLTAPDAVSLMGSRCAGCGETALGVSRLCQNCGSDDLAPMPLSREGKLWTYTVVRHRPPGDYMGPDPFVPFALGLVELPDGIRVFSPIGGDVEALSIGQPLRFRPVRLGEGERAVTAFEFTPLDGEAATHG